MKISTKGRYALEAVVDLVFYAGQEIETIKNISDRLGISKNYLEQIFIELRKNNIVVSVRGAQGGYKLARSAEDIFVGEIIRALEGELSPVICLEEHQCLHPCNDYSKCIARKIWQGLADTINDVVDHITIGELVRSYTKDKDKVKMTDFVI